MTDLERLLYKELYSRSFYDFVKDFWNTCDPVKFIDGNLVQFLCETFHYFCRKWVGYKEIKIKLPPQNADLNVIDVRENKQCLCLCIPPRHTKSMIFNVLGPVWLWTHHPIKAVSISHTGGLATSMNSKRYMTINSDLFKELYGEIRLISNSGSFLKDSRGGELYSLNRNAFTGYGGDVIINDDLTNAETARKNMLEMANAWHYYRNTMPSRINDINKCIILNIQQRLAPNDITGHILNDKKLAETYTFVTIPAIFEKETLLVCPISGKIFHYNAGDPLWPERYGDYKVTRYQVGESIFQTQYLQKPVASDLTVIKNEMITEKAVLEVPSIESADVVYASHDFPVKDKEESDYLGSVLAYRVRNVLYIIDCLEKHLAFVRSVEYVRQLDQIYPGCIQIIEDKANGSPILQQLQEEVAGMQAYQPGTASKMQRLESASWYMNSKNVVFVKSDFNRETNEYNLSESLKILKERLLAFPFIEHDDIVDAFSMLVLFVFMDKKYNVYGRSFKSENIISYTAEKKLYSNIFVNREGNLWKISEIGIEYGETSKLIVLRELRLKSKVETVLSTIKKWAPEKKLYIDCSESESLQGVYTKDIVIERYAIPDFDKSVMDLILAFERKTILIDKQCVYSISDIENYKYAKTKDETSKYITMKDGFVANIRTAMIYYGGIA